MFVGVGVVVTNTCTVNARLTQLLSHDGRRVALVSRDRRHLTDVNSSYSLLAVVKGPADLRALESTNIRSASLFVTIAPIRDAGVASDVLTGGLNTGHAITHISGPRCVRPRTRRFFGRLNVDGLVCPRVLTTMSVGGKLGVD